MDEVDRALNALIDGVYLSPREYFLKDTIDCPDEERCQWCFLKARPTKPRAELGVTLPSGRFQLCLDCWFLLAFRVDHSGYCSTCECWDKHSGACADQNAVFNYDYGQHPIPYPPDAPRRRKDG